MGQCPNRTYEVARHQSQEFDCAQLSWNNCESERLAGGGGKRITRSDQRKSGLCRCAFQSRGDLRHFVATGARTGERAIHPGNEAWRSAGPVSREIAALNLVGRDSVEPLHLTGATIPDRELAISRHAQLRGGSEDPGADGPARNRAGFRQRSNVSQRGRLSISRHPPARTADPVGSRFRGGESAFLRSQKISRHLATRGCVCARTGAKTRDSDNCAGVLWRAISCAADESRYRTQRRKVEGRIFLEARSKIGINKNYRERRTANNSSGNARGVHHRTLLGLYFRPRRLQRIPRRTSAVESLDRRQF